MTLYGGIEGGGTKFVCAVGTGPDDIRAEVRFPTKSPEETIPQAITFFREQQAQLPLASIGIASFGPIDPDPSSATFGHVTNTPKPGWAHTDFAGMVAKATGVPVGLTQMLTSPLWANIAGALLRDWTPLSISPWVRASAAGAWSMASLFTG